MRVTKRVEALLHEIMENGLVFDVRTDTNDNGGGKVREYRCPAPACPLSSIRKSLSSAGKRAGLGHVRPDAFDNDHLLISLWCS